MTLSGVASVYPVGPARVAHIVCIAARQDNARDQAGATPLAIGCDQPRNTCSSIQSVSADMWAAEQDDMVIGAIMVLIGEHASFGLHAWGISPYFGRHVS